MASVSSIPFPAERRARIAAEIAKGDWQTREARAEQEAAKWLRDVFKPLKVYLALAKDGLAEGPLSCDEERFYVGGRISGCPNALDRPIGIGEIRAIAAIEADLRSAPQLSRPAVEFPKAQILLPVESKRQPLKESTEANPGKNKSPRQGYRSKWRSTVVMKVTGATQRQLQWWDEREVIRPTITAHARFYTDGQVMQCALAVELIRKGVSSQAARKIVRLKEGEDFAGYLVTDGRTVLIEEPDTAGVIETMQDSQLGLVVISLADIHKKVEEYQCRN